MQHGFCTVCMLLLPGTKRLHSDAALCNTRGCTRSNSAPDQPRLDATYTRTQCMGCHSTDALLLVGFLSVQGPHLMMMTLPLNLSVSFSRAASMSSSESKHSACTQHNQG